MFVFEEYEKEVANQMSMVNDDPGKDDKLRIDEWIGLAVDKVFKKRN